MPTPENAVQNRLSRRAFLKIGTLGGASRCRGAHELAHGIDGTNHELSDSKEWGDVWAREILGNDAFTRKAQEDYREAFSEVGGLLLGGRRWLASDRLPFAGLNSDPRVVEFFPGALSPSESDAMVDRIEAHFERHGFGLWAVEIPGITPFAGFIGLSIPRFDP